MAADSHPFRSEATRDEFLSFYDRRAERWPERSESALVATSFGQTFVRQLGSDGGAPILLLPGDSETSLAWLPIVEALADNHRIFAVDHINGIGRSVSTRQMRSRDDFLCWLNELVEALGLAAVRVVAHSYGGWQAARFALAHPGRVESLVLLAPAATVLSPSLQVLTRAMALSLFPTRAVMKSYLYWQASDCVRDPIARAVIDDMVEERMLARRCYRRRRFFAPTVVSDEEWQSLDVPTLFVVGENDVTCDADRAVERLNRVAPQVRTVIAAGSDHFLTLIRPDWLADEILRFMAGV